jgi:hypothetical protein
VRRKLRRARLSYKRTSRSVRHKQNIDGIIVNEPVQVEPTKLRNRVPADPPSQPWPIEADWPLTRIRHRNASQIVKVRLPCPTKYILPNHNQVPPAAQTTSYREPTKKAHPTSGVPFELGM